MPYYKFAMNFSGIVLRNRKKLFLLERLRDGESSGLRIPLTPFSKGDTCRGAAYWVLPEAALRLQRDEVVSPFQGFAPSAASRVPLAKGGREIFSPLVRVDF